MLVRSIIKILKSWVTNRTTSTEEAHVTDISGYTEPSDSGAISLDCPIPTRDAEESKDVGEGYSGSDLQVSESINDASEDGGQSDSDGTDWQDFDEDLVDIEETDVREEPWTEVETDGRIERSRQALQKAIDLCVDYNWDVEGIQILAEVFERYGWSATRAAVERQLRLGLSSSELRQAFAVREIWESYPEFSTASMRHYSSYLSWPVALMIVRSYEWLPEREELEVFLSEAFTRWKWHSHSSHYYSDFLSYLIATVRHAANYSLSYPGAIFDVDRFFRERVIQDESGYDVDEAICEISGECQF